jgi:hypothetical protein
MIEADTRKNHPKDKTEKTNNFSKINKNNRMIKKETKKKLLIIKDTKEKNNKAHKDSIIDTLTTN